MKEDFCWALAILLIVVTILLVASTIVRVVMWN